jgi:hypothetical protein
MPSFLFEQHAITSGIITTYILWTETRCSKKILYLSNNGRTYAACEQCFCFGLIVVLTTLYSRTLLYLERN